MKTHRIFFSVEEQQLRPRGAALPLMVALLLTLFTACGEEPISAGDEEGESSAGTTEWPCAPPQRAPYASGIPYLGIHGDAGNSDLIDCETAPAWQPAWHQLQGLAITQPNTFSPDGAVTYVTTSNPEPNGCRLFAVEIESGAIRWCQPFSTSIERSSVEVDEEGDLYFTVDEALISLDADGQERWRLALEDIHGDPAGGWGVHFTPQGHVVTVTASGRVYLVRRRDGEPLATFDIASHWGFMAPETFGGSLDPSSLLPESTQRDIQSVWGAPSDEEQAAGFGALLGSGTFVDNTVGISERGDIYVIGGGPSESEGALVQLRVGGSPEAPVLSPGWYAVTERGSATTPSISPGDQYVVIGDGAHPSTFFDPANARGHVRSYDIERCDTNQDADPDPRRCGERWSYPVERIPLVGAPAVLEDGTVIYWEMGFTFDASPTAADVVALRDGEKLWEVALPDNMDWSSVITVTRNHIIGTASRVEPSDIGLPGFKLPHRSSDRVVVLDRETGALRWHHILPDDGAATVTIGPDGSLYVPMLGIFSILALEERPTLGMMRFTPSELLRPPPALPSPESLVEAWEAARASTPDEGQGGAEQPDERSPELMSAPEDEAGAGAGSGDSGGPRACFPVEVEALPSCCDEGPARCVDAGLIPDGFASQLAPCGDAGLCVPEPILAAEDEIAPPPCASIAGRPGVCLSKCLPEVAQNSALLPQDVCAAGEICVPCVSPLDGQETGACGVIQCGGGEAQAPDMSNPDDADEAEQGMAPPEESDPPAPGGAGEDESMPDESMPDESMPDEEQPGAGGGGAPVCCGGGGVCLGEELVPDEDEGSLRSCRREGHRALLCVPNDFLDPTWTPTPCQGSGIIGGDYEGVCLSECLKLPFEFALDQASCGPRELCVPCRRPLTGRPSGAPGCAP